MVHNLHLRLGDKVVMLQVQHLQQMEHRFNLEVVEVVDNPRLRRNHPQHPDLVLVPLLVHLRHLWQILQLRLVVIKVNRNHLDLVATTINLKPIRFVLLQVVVDLDNRIVNNQRHLDLVVITIIITTTIIIIIISKTITTLSVHLKVVILVLGNKTMVKHNHLDLVVTIINLKPIRLVLRRVVVDLDNKVDNNKHRVLDNKMEVVVAILLEVANNSNKATVVLVVQIQDLDKVQQHHKVKVGFR